jgi:hypothetical protein
LLEAVESVRTILSGEYINSRNVDVASSLKSTIEDRIRDAGGAYTTAAIKEVNAVRALNKQQPLTNDEALKLATTVKSRFDYLAQDPTYLAEKVRDGNLKILKTALDKAKVSLFKGPSKLQKATPVIKQERDPLTMLRNEMAKKEPDPKRVAQLRKEIDALKKEDDDIIISDLRGQATRMWQERGRLVKELKTARKENKSIIKNAIQEIDDTVDSRNKQIDELHARG